MVDNMLEHKLEELWRHFSTLQQCSLEDLAQVKKSLPGVLAGLQLSLEELQTIVGEHPKRRTGSNGSSRANGTRSKVARSAVARSAVARAAEGLRLRAMAERSPVMVRIMGSETRCRWANRAWLEFTGRSLEQLRGEGWLEDVHPEDRGRCAKICHEASDANRLNRMEYRLKRQSGEYGWVLELGTPRLTTRGSLGGYLGAATEITEHKRAETHLARQYAVARVLSEAKSLEDVATPLLQLLCETLGWHVAELWCVDSKERVPRCAQLWADPSIDVSELQESSRTRVWAHGAGSPWQSCNPPWIADIAIDETFAREPEAQRCGLRGMFRLPVSVQGEVCAILRVFCSGVRQWDDAVVEFMSAVGVQLSQFLERQRNLERVRESEARKAAILDAALDAVITIDAQGKVHEFNSAAQTIFGYGREDAFGAQLLDLIVPPRMREQVLARVASFQATGKSDFLCRRFDATAMKSDGSEFPVEVAMAATGAADPSMLTIYVCDATARKNAERKIGLYQDRQRSLMADLLLAEEHERRRLAVDLHDGLSQTMALAQMKLSALRLCMHGRLASSLDELEQLIKQANRDARSISFELSPPVLHDLGLEPAVQWLVENIHTRYGVEIVLQDDGQLKPADDTIRVILFRSIRELLINAAKHARARRVHVYLEREEDRLNAAVEDDGVGMEPDVVGVQGSGLFSIQERLSHIGGSMRIDSGPGRGTKIRLSTPLTSKKTTKAMVGV